MLGKRLDNYIEDYKICITVCITELRVILYHEKSRCKLFVYNDLKVDDIGLENSAETRGISLFDPKVTPNPTLLSQWILKNYSDREIKELILLIGQ